MPRSKRRDPDRLDVKYDPNSDHIFIWWLYEDGPSGTLTLSPERTKSFALDLENCALVAEMSKEIG